jgi:hypothetical protein
MTDKDNAVQQAQQWAQEARTQRETVLSILRYFGLPERDYEALTLIRQKVESVAADWDECHYDAPAGEIEIGPAIRRALIAHGVALPRRGQP